MVKGWFAVSIHDDLFLFDNYASELILINRPVSFSSGWKKIILVYVTKFEIYVSNVDD